MPIVCYYNAAISIHASREGGDYVVSRLETRMPISIHASREGGDGLAHVIYGYRAKGISIHASREGGDIYKTTI